MHVSSMESCQNFAKKYLNPQDELFIADIGSYDVNGTYRKAVNEPNWKYIGLDIRQGPNVDYVIPEEPEYAWWYCWSPADECIPVDVVLSGSTLEHVRKPWIWIRQVDHILKSGGLCFINVPNTWEHHDYPHDYWRLWPEALEVLFQEVGWETLETFTWGPYGNDTVGIARKP